MGIVYYKRFRMEADLGRSLPGPDLPDGYRLVSWRDGLLDAHAEAKHLSFADEIDSRVFPCLGERDGCERLVREIVGKPGFLPAATWLVECTAASGDPEPVGAIQGVRVSPRYGAVQNIGVTPWARGRGVGRALVLAAIGGFREAGLRRVTLEVTATNSVAVALYESLGFRRVRISYRSVATPEPVGAVVASR
ncbi:MAG: GNAT family N-acetyltransferase [Planctomycetota bacterium]